MTSGNVIILLIPIFIVGGATILMLLIQILRANFSSYNKQMKRLAIANRFEMEHQNQMRIVVLIIFAMISSMFIGFGFSYRYIIGITCTIVSVNFIIFIALSWRPKNKIRIVISTEKIELFNGIERAFCEKWKDIKEIEFFVVEYYEPHSRYIPSHWSNGEGVILRGNGCEKRIHLFSFSYKHRLIAKVLKAIAKKLGVVIYDNPEIFTYPKDKPLLEVLGDFNPLHDLKNKRKKSEFDHEAWKRYCISLISFLIVIIISTIVVLLLNYDTITPSMMSGAIIGNITLAVVILFVILIIYLEVSSKKEEIK